MSAKAGGEEGVAPAGGTGSSRRYTAADVESALPVGRPFLLEHDGALRGDERGGRWMVRYGYGGPTGGLGGVQDGA
jgi:hypothetical protein